MVGESCVLPGNMQCKLLCTGIVPGSVSVRNTYEAGADGCVVYEEGRDYVVDYPNGTLARACDSRIPDYTTNQLYGQKEFDHSKFPDFGNGGFFVFVDYEAANGVALFEDTQQAEALKNTRAKLEKGGPFKIVVFGDSITFGIDCSALHLRFQQRYAKYLAEQFPKAEITVENGATNGDNSVGGVNKLEDKVLSRKPDLVLVGFGMNDHNKNGVPEAAFEANLVTIAKAVKEKAGADVLMYSTFPPNPDWAFGSHRMEVYAAATRRAAEQAGCAYADVNAVWLKVLARKDCNSVLGNNINHPSDWGHWLYLETLKSVKF